ncbi:MAG: tetratricopeptide repeat protein [Anaerolineae bacterium]|nr:tetratricopeptide repeat protein [Anaerolineae bacterium]
MSVNYRKMRGVLLICLGILTACNLQPEPAITYVVITATSTQTTAAIDTPIAFTPTETPTLTPTLTPTPDLPPDTTLRIGDRYLLDGYFEDAILTYASLVNRPDASPEIRAAAAFGQGRAALREGLFDQAVPAFSIVITNYPADLRAPWAYFLRGDAYLGLNNWTAAISDFEAYLRLRPNVIDSYAYERIADAQLALGQYDQALVSYDLAINAGRTTVPQVALREKVAQIQLSGGNTSAAIAQYDAILAVAQNAPYRATIEYRAAEALLDGGQGDAALTRMRRIVETYPGTPEALLAVEALTTRDRPVDLFSVGLVRYLNGDHQGAIVAFNEHSSTVPSEQIPANFYLLLGRAYREVGNAPAALVAFETVQQLYPTSPLLGESLLERGRTRFLSGDINGAIETYLEIADTFGYLAEAAAEALWRAGFLYNTNGQRDQSRVIFERLAADFPTSTQAQSGLQIAADAALAAGDLTSAESLFTQITTLATGEPRANAYLQLGLLARQRGDQTGANAAFTQAVSAAPDTYASLRAADLLNGVAPFQRPAAYEFQFDEAAQIVEAETWLRTQFNLTDPSERLWVMPPELENDPRLIRGRELWTVNAIDAAEIEFFDVIDQYKADPLNSYRLALHFRGLAAYTPSITAAANVILAARVSTLQAPSLIARLRYPLYYRDVLVRTTEASGVDPLLMAALIRQESLFDTYATAAAGEKGLTQVIPPTGEYIAGQLAWPDYQHSDLFRPYAGIAFGVFYLSEQLTRFDGRAIPALAAYNAGPGRAIQWLETAGNDPDRFLQVITIDSTRKYVQLIYRNHAIYRGLYGRS